MPRAQAIFVAQAGRKFRLFSLTLQRYNIFIAVYEFCHRFFLVYSRFSKFAAVPVSPLQRYSSFSSHPHPKNMPIFIYIFIYINIELKSTFAYSKI